MIRRLSALIFILTYPELSLPKEGGYYYIVEQDDVISQVLYRADIKPIYGPHGKLNLLKRYNSSEITNLEYVKPGQKIKFPEDVVVEALRSSAITIKDDSQILFINLETYQAPIDKPNLTSPPSLPQTLTNTSISATDEFYSDLRFALQMDYLVLNGTEISNNSKAKLLSDLNNSWLLSWIHHWSKDEASKILFSQQQVNISPESHTIPLYNTTLSLSSFGVGYLKKINPTWKVGGTLKYSQQLFYRGYLGAGGGLELNKVPLLQLTPELSYHLITKKNVLLFLKTEVSYYSPSHYDTYAIEVGYGYNISIQLEQTLSSNNVIFCGLSFEQKNQPTSLVRISQQNIGASCGYQWGLN